MIKCSEYEEMISAYVDGELSAAEKAELTAHLDTCESCRNLLEVYKNMAELSSENTAEPPAELLQNVMAGISAIKPAVSNSKKRIKRLAVRYIAVAACIAVTIMAVPRILGGYRPDISAALTSDSETPLYETYSGTATGTDAAGAGTDGSVFSDTTAGSASAAAAGSGAADAAGSVSSAPDIDNTNGSETNSSANTGAAEPAEDYASAANSSAADTGRSTASKSAAANQSGSGSGSASVSVTNSATDISTGSKSESVDAVSAVVSDNSVADTSAGVSAVKGYTMVSDKNTGSNDVLYTDSEYAGVITVNGSLPKILSSSELYVNGNGVCRIYIDKYTAGNLLRIGYKIDMNQSPMSDEFVVIYTPAA